LDVDPRDPRVIELVLDVAPDLDVLVQEGRVVLGGEPARAPRARRAEAEADRMCLLTHTQSFSFVDFRFGAVPRRALAAGALAARAGAGAAVVSGGEAAWRRATGT